MNQKNHEGGAKVSALLAALLYSLSSPFNKMLLSGLPAMLLAGLLYIGAGAGITAIWLVRRKGQGEKRLEKKDTPYVLGMVALDGLAPVFLLMGLGQTTAATASLLNTFEIVATALLAMVFFKEKISPRLMIGIGLVTVATMILSFDQTGELKFSPGALLILLACFCWGLENNCTRRISHKDPLQIVMIKGWGSGTLALMAGLITGEKWKQVELIPVALLLGFVAYGVSICCYIYAQRELGAAKTSLYYGTAPFMGVLLSLILFHQLPKPYFYLALGIMAAGTILTSLPDGSEASGEESQITSQNTGDCGQ